MPIRNTYVKKWAHHEINKAVNKLKRGHSLPKQLSKDRLKTFDHVYHRSEIRLASIKNDEKKNENANKSCNGNGNGNDQEKQDRPRGEYLHEQIEKDKLGGLQALDGGRDCCCWNSCQYTIIPGSFANVLVQCSNGCHMRYHNDLSDDADPDPNKKSQSEANNTDNNDNNHHHHNRHVDGCWNLIQKNYKKTNNNNNIDYSQKCIKKNCKGKIVSIVHCIGFEPQSNESIQQQTQQQQQQQNGGDDEEEDDVSDSPSDHVFDLGNLAEPPSGFDIFCKELFIKPENRLLRPRIIDAKWRALSRPKRRRYDDRARILQLQWIRLKQKSQALDYSLKVDQASNSSPKSSTAKPALNADNDSPHRSPHHQQPQSLHCIDDQEKRKKLLAEERQKRIEDMIAQNPNIYDLDQRQKKEEHKKKTEKLLNKRKKKKIKNKKNKKTKNTVSLSDLNDIADQWANEKPLRSPSVTPSHKSNDNPFDNQPQQTQQQQPLSAQQQQQQTQPHKDLTNADHYNAPQLHANSANIPNIPQPQLNPPTSKLQEWVSLAKQPKFKSSSTSTSASASSSSSVSVAASVSFPAGNHKQDVVKGELSQNKVSQTQTTNYRRAPHHQQYAQQTQMNTRQIQQQAAPPQHHQHPHQQNHPHPHPQQQQTHSLSSEREREREREREVLSTWDRLKESIVCGDRIFIEIPCSSASSPYILVSTASILQEWSDRLEDFHRWCTQYGLCRFLPISQCANNYNQNNNSRAVILEFSFVNNAKIARDKLEKKLSSKISFVEWRFGHAYFFKHSYVKLNEEIIMTGKEFKRMDQILLSKAAKKSQAAKNKHQHQNQNQNGVLRPWEAYPHLSLPIDYQSILSSPEPDEATTTSSNGNTNTNTNTNTTTTTTTTRSSSGDTDNDSQQLIYYEEDPQQQQQEEEEENTEEEEEEEEEEEDKRNVNVEGNKIIYADRILYIGDIVYMALYPRVPFIIHKNIGNGYVEILKPDNTKECVAISCLQNALSFPSLHQDTKNENELRFRQSLLEALSECQLDYLLVCME